MEKSIETQHRLWSQWFEELGAPGEAGEPRKKTSAKPKNKEKKRAASTRKAANTSAKSGDDLKRISGIGPVLEKKLKDNGISTLKQIAAWSDDDIAQIEEKIVRLSGRIKREQWVEQARSLVS